MNLEKIRSITWEEIWEQWRKDEEGLWEDHYAEEGFSDWESWRGKQKIAAFLRKNKWNLFKIPDPLQTVPEFFVGPYKGWRKFYTDMRHSRFKDIVEHPTYIGSDSQDKAKAILDTFPNKTQLMGTRSGGEVVILEGTHRCCALAEAAKQGAVLKTSVTVALADIPQDEWDKYHNMKKDLPINTD